ncbi:uncharacterized protein C8R40DRAFT_1125927 [Lentinula edodes]|uniref:uncharacterized protein n=1 Tax=Lentinula edodes TaxID=5353 RepID=UPI001E8DF3BA|nr:uncharacterized protein C8R40DRAFT_1125927 [Lentinula edodes]KAH7870480.1 hypothetical protein C8R40DRAFT_1125927 [Lentinula edodes]
MSSNRSQHQQQEDWQSDTSAFPVIPPDSTTSSSASTSLTSALPAPLNSSSSAPLDVSSIDGNVSDQAKRHVMDMLAYYTGAKEESFGVAIARRLQMRSMNVWATSPGNAQGRIPQRATEAQTIFEIPITKDMCNPYGTLHGACACYIVDPCSMSAIVVLGAALGIDATGVSQSMNLIWHRPAKIGTRLRAISTSIFIEGRIRTARVEIMDSETDKLYVSAIHSTIGPKPDSRAKLAKL